MDSINRNPTGISTEILIITFRRDLQMLEWNLRSIQKFATGFDVVKIVVPWDQLDEFLPLEKYRTADGKPVLIRRFFEYPGKGMIHHEAMVCHADSFCPHADLILHTDADCIFTGPVSPETYLVDGKPLLLVESWDDLEKEVGGRSHPVFQWKGTVERALQMPCEFETMRGHPAVHLRKVYGGVRARVENVHELPFEHYVLQCRNEFPQSFCEFDTLGTWALFAFRDKYHVHDVWKNGYPPNPLRQGWTAWNPSNPDHQQRRRHLMNAWASYLNERTDEGDRHLKLFRKERN